MSNRESNLIKIGFAGRTNSGKTTTIRSLMRKAVGVVANEPNVTREAEEFKSSSSAVYIGIQAIFVDCPGFQLASLTRHYLDDLDVVLEKDEKAIYDVRAIKALRGVDVIIYVADLSNVPDDSYVNEIELIKSLGIGCVIVLNKLRKTSEEGNRSNAKEMINQWKEKIHSVCTFPIIQLDAQWEKPTQVKELYRLINGALPWERKNLFTEGLEKFYQEQKKIEEKIVSELVKLTITCRRTREVEEFGRNGVGALEGKDSLESVLIEQCNQASAQFFISISNIYNISANPGSDEGVDYHHSSETKFWDVIKGGSVGAADGAAAGAAIGKKDKTPIY